MVLQSRDVHLFWVVDWFSAAGVGADMAVDELWEPCEKLNEPTQKVDVFLLGCEFEESVVVLMFLGDVNCGIAVAEGEEGDGFSLFEDPPCIVFVLPEFLD